MLKFTCIFLLLVPLTLDAQQNTLPISSYYKDQLFAPQNQSFGQQSTFFPRSEGEYNLHKIIRDSSKFYYRFAETLFKKHLFEIEGDGYAVNISPLFNLSLGQDFSDTSSRRLFNNTRGFIVEADILENFSFSTSFFENQNRFTNYETQYYSSIGERYPNPIEGYNIQNAVVPSGARTKPFKGDGFDYAYAIGNLIYSPKSYLRFMFGNNANFVGAGYRSLFLSDNSVPATYIRADVTIAKKFDYTVLRSKQFNLLRRPFRTTVEAYYEGKLFSSHFLNYRPTSKISFSLFEGSYWSTGDSISSTAVNAGYYVPLPFVGTFFSNENQVSTLAGLQVQYSPIPTVRFYSQLAFSNWKMNQIGLQLGTRYYNPFGIKEGLIQVEYNSVPSGLYLSPNSRLHYSAYNLPTAHPKGNGFGELVIRLNMSYNRMYFDSKSVMYQLNNYAETNLIASNFNIQKKSGAIYHQQTEIGYRFNKKINLQLFLQHIYRQSSVAGEIQTNAVFGGIRTGLTNLYNDF